MQLPSICGDWDRVAVILRLISSKTTVMRFGVTDSPWERGTRPAASDSSHLSVASSNSVEPRAFHGPAALATWIVTAQFLKTATTIFCKLLPW